MWTFPLTVKYWQNVVGTGSSAMSNCVYFSSFNGKNAWIDIVLILLAATGNLQVKRNNVSYFWTMHNKKKKEKNKFASINKKYIKRKLKIILNKFFFSQIGLLVWLIASSYQLQCSLTTP